MQIPILSPASSFFSPAPAHPHLHLISLPSSVPSTSLPAHFPQTILTITSFFFSLRQRPSSLTHHHVLSSCCHQPSPSSFHFFSRLGGDHHHSFIFFLLGRRSPAIICIDTSITDHLQHHYHHQLQPLHLFQPVIAAAALDVDVAVSGVFQLHLLTVSACQSATAAFSSA